MDFTGRPMRTMVFVQPRGIASSQALAGWVDLALAHVRGLPPKATGRRGRSD